MNTPTYASPCTCGRLNADQLALTYGQCCGPFLEGRAVAPDAHALMRSRYSAFVLQRAPYLLATWHSSKRPSKVSFDAGVKWLGLEVRQCEEQDATHATVEFVARQRQDGGRALRLHERSRFVCEGGQWFYVDGEHLT